MKKYQIQIKMNPDFTYEGAEGLVKTFTYEDTVAGKQSIAFDRLSEIVDYIEEFGWNGDSEGTIYHNGEAILSYVSRENALFWGGITI